MAAVAAAVPCCSPTWTEVYPLLFSLAFYLGDRCVSFCVPCVFMIFLQGSIRTVPCSIFGQSARKTEYIMHKCRGGFSKIRDCTCSAVCPPPASWSW